MNGTAFRNKMRRIASAARAIPGHMGWRPYTVQVERRAWDGDERGEGAETVTTTTITERGGQHPKVRQLTAEEIAVGGFDEGSWQVGPITPDYGSGGTAVTDLQPSAHDNDVIQYVLTGPQFPNGARFRLRQLTTDHAGHYLVTLERAADK